MHGVALSRGWDDQMEIEKRSQSSRYFGTFGVCGNSIRGTGSVFCKVFLQS